MAAVLMAGALNGWTATLTFSVPVSGDIPGAPPPWLTATFTEIDNGVRLTAIPNLTGQEAIRSLALGMIGAGIEIRPVSGPGFTATLAPGGITAGPAHGFDIEFEFNAGPPSARWKAGQLMVADIIGGSIAGLRSNSDGPTTGFVAAAHVIAIGLDGEGSGWIGAGAPPRPTHAEGVTMVAWTDGSSTLLLWTALSEIDTLGYHVEIQSEKRWMRVTDGILPADGRNVPYSHSGPVAEAFRLISIDLRGEARIVAQVTATERPRLTISSTGTGSALRVAGNGVGLRILAAETIHGPWRQIGPMPASGLVEIEMDQATRFFQVTP